MTSLAQGKKDAFFYKGRVNAQFTQTEILASPHGVVFKRARQTFPRGDDSDCNGMVLFRVPNLPLYMQYINQGTPEMYGRDEHNEPVLIGRPASGYSVLSAEQGQAPWVERAGFSFSASAGDEIDAADFFDPSRPVSLDMTWEPKDSCLSVLFEQMYMTAYFLLDPRTQRLSCKDKQLVAVILNAPRVPPPKQFTFK